MPNVYESTISPILEAAKDQGATDVFMTGGEIPYILTRGALGRLDGHTPVAATDIDLFLESFGFGGHLGGAIQFSAERSAAGDAFITFRHIAGIPPEGPAPTP